MTLGCTLAPYHTRGQSSVTATMRFKTASLGGRITNFTEGESALFPTLCMRIS